MKKKGLSIFLALAMCVGPLPTTAMADGIWNGHNNHPICGMQCKDKETHDTVENWIEKRDLDITEPGYYFLGADVTISETWKPINGVTLCLNGHNIIANGDFNAIMVDNGATFTLTDCKTGEEQGKITHTEGATGFGVYVYTTDAIGSHIPDSTFIMYGGSIADNNSSGVGIRNSIFTMYGGSITGNKSSYSGGGVSEGISATFNMYGGSITGNQATIGGGVYISLNRPLKLGGNATIYGNTDKNGNPSNVYRDRKGEGSFRTHIDIEDGFHGKVGIRTSLTPNPGYPVQFTVNNCAEYVNCFTSDASTTKGEPYRVKVNSNGALILKYPLQDQTDFAFAETTKTVTYGDEDFTVTATGQVTSSTVTYSSSDTSVATVDKTSGLVHILKAGTATITATASATDDFDDAQAQCVLTIAPKPIVFSNITADAKTYDGNTDSVVHADNVQISGLVGEDTLTADDYTVTGVFADANAGVNKDVNLTVTLNDTDNTKNYTVSADSQKIASATIHPKEIAVATVSATDRKYDPNSNTVDCDVTFADNANPVKDTDYTVVGTIADKNASTNPKDVNVTVTLINPNYTFAEDKDTATANTTVTISKADGKTFTVNQLHKYTNPDSKSLTPDWLLPTDSAWRYSAGSYSVSDGTDVDIVKQFDVNVDTGVLTYQISDGKVNDTITFPIIASCDNYDDYIYNVTVTLTDKDILTVKANDITTTYTGNAVPDTAITGTATFEGNTVEGTWSFESASLVNVADSTDNVSVVFTPAEANVYAIAKDTIQVTINKATPSGTPEYTSITTSDRTLADAELRVGTITPEGTIAWNDDNATVVEANKAYDWTFTPNDTENYETLTGNITPYVVSSSSSGGGHSSRTSYAVSSTATDNGAISSNVKTARKGDTVTITVQPENGYKLDKLTVTDASGNALTVTDKGDGTYTFTMPNSKVEITPTFVAETTTEPEPDPEPTPETNPFTDVHAEDYFFDAVKWAADKNITGGIDTNLFGPNIACTRAQIVTFLWRAAGSPAAQAMSSFFDVAEDAYYAKAVAWAVENGITNGTSEDTFSPDLPCTRAQSMTFLYRASKAKAPDGTPAFSDVAADAYYAAAVKWATENNITSGMGDGLFGPDYECTRAQIVTFLYRLYTK